jgi:hypothetical protein
VGSQSGTKFLFDGKLQGKAQGEVQEGIYLPGFGKRMGLLFFFGDRLKEEVKD